MRASNLGNWNLHLFARVREEEYKYECLGGLRYKECIPYQGNEHLLGTNKSKCARVSIYEKGYKGYRNDVFDRPIEKDYRLSRPTKIKKIGKKSID